jgi:hypothetical protein
MVDVDLIETAGFTLYGANPRAAVSAPADLAV